MRLRWPCPQTGATRYAPGLSCRARSGDGMKIDAGVCKCGTAARKMPRCGKRRYRHKCPHGRWCQHGDRLHGAHANHNTRCRDCMDEKVRARLTADPNYTIRGDAIKKANAKIMKGNDVMKLTQGQRETLARAAETGRVVTHGRRSPHHQRLADRGLLKQGRIRLAAGRYRGTAWAITADGRNALRGTA